MNIRKTCIYCSTDEVHYQVNSDNSINYHCSHCNRKFNSFQAEEYDKMSMWQQLYFRYKITLGNREDVN